MSASAANSQGHLVHVMVKTLSGELIPISFDRSGNEKEVERRVLHAFHEAAPEFPIGQMKIIRPIYPEGVNVTNTNSKMVEGKLSETTEDDMLWTVVRDLVTLDEVERSVEGYDDIIFYVFHLRRDNDQIMDIEQITIDDYQEERLSPEQAQEHIRQFPIQHLIIYYDPVTKRHTFLYTDYRTDDANARARIFYEIKYRRGRGPMVYDFDAVMEDQLDYYYFLHGYHPNGNANNEDLFRFGEGEEEKIDKIIFQLSPTTVQEIKEKIKNHPLTPRDALIYEQHGGKKRGYRKTKKGKKAKKVRRTKKHRRHSKHRRR